MDIDSSPVISTRNSHQTRNEIKSAFDEDNFSSSSFDSEENPNCIQVESSDLNSYCPSVSIDMSTLDNHYYNPRVNPLPPTSPPNVDPQIEFYYPKSYFGKNDIEMQEIKVIMFL